MKTIKKPLTTAMALCLLALGMNAQSSKMKKACIKMEKDENGVVTKIDTCVTAATDEELKQKLAALNMGDLPELPPLPEVPETEGIPPVPPVPPTPPAPPAPGSKGKSVSVSKTIIIDEGEDDKSGSRKKVKVVSSTGKDDQVIVMDENGKIISSESGDASANVVVKQLKKGEKMDKEIEKMLKENGIDMEDGGEGKQVIITTDKHGTKDKDVRVVIYKKVDIETLTDADKKQLPPSVSKSVSTSNPFTNLNLAPNPTDDACTISYLSAGKEPLQINVYNTEGKMVYNETEKNVSEQMNKSISLKNLSEGTYFVHLTQGSQSEVRKIVVKK